VRQRAADGKRSTDWPSALARAIAPSAFPLPRKIYDEDGALESRVALHITYYLYSYAWRGRGVGYENGRSLRHFYSPPCDDDEDDVDECRRSFTLTASMPFSSL